MSEATIAAGREPARHGAVVRAVLTYTWHQVRRCYVCADEWVPPLHPLRDTMPPPRVCAKPACQAMRGVRL